MKYQAMLIISPFLKTHMKQFFVKSFDVSVVKNQIFNIYSDTFGIKNEKNH
jgi:hypothetical protein